jgi:hypothetical protein
MPTTTYRVTLADGQTFSMFANLTEASAPLRANFSGEEDGDVVSPYQTADAGHRKHRAAELLAEYFATEGDSTEVVFVEAR